MAERCVIVHSLAHAQAAVAAAQALGCEVTLLSAPGAGASGGAPWFAAVVKVAGAVSSVLDCADQPGTVLGALRCGLKRIRFTGAEATAIRLRDIAAQYNATIEGPEALPALDLLDAANPEAACRAYLARED